MIDNDAECQAVQSEEYFDTEHDHEILKNLCEMRRNGTLIDLRPVVDGIEFPCHIAVVSSSSDYFLALCNSNLIPLDRRVQLTNITASTYEKLLDFMYTGKITISPENVEDLLRGSSMLLLDKTKRKCSQYIMSLLNANNCLGIMSIADELSCEDLYNKALKVTQKYFSDVYLQPDFLQLPFHLVQQLAASDATSVSSEDSMYYAVMKWMLFKEDRKKFFPDLFLSLRLRFVSEKTFTTDFEQCPYINNSQACIERLQEAQDLRARLARGARQLITSSSADGGWMKPRSCMSDVNVIVAVGGVNALIYNAELNSWIQLSQVVTRHCPGIGVLDNDIIIVGGSREWKRQGAGARYDPKRNQWLHMVPLNHKRSNLELVSLDGFLYAIGGYDGDTPLRYDDDYYTALDLPCMQYSMFQSNFYF